MNSEGGGFIARFELGEIYVTDGVLEKVDETSQMRGLNSHANCIWGEISEEDTRANFNALVHGGRMFSTFTASNGVKFWVITDAVEAGGTETTLMLPGEY